MRRTADGSLVYTISVAFNTEYETNHTDKSYLESNHLRLL